MTTRTVNGNVNIPTADVAGLRWPSKRKTICERDSITQRPPSHGGQYTATPHSDRRFPNARMPTAAGQLMLPVRERPAPMLTTRHRDGRSFSSPRLVSSPAPFVSHIANKMLYQMAIIVGAISLIHMGPYIVGAVEAWMRNENFSIAVGFNMTLQFYWGGGLIERDLTLFRAVIPRDQVVPAA
ncbi:hypothetical protein EDB85DRAFT_1901415 [Lactarius pseudohatsudake]|nr:hypothetical protein EDB85DRAFT_1901415 [Lactarius pseudohatsudake]